MLSAFKVRYLGCCINADGVKLLPERVEAIRAYLRPKTIAELRRFLSIINFYRRFLHRAATIQAPLDVYLRGAKCRDNREITWTDAAIKVFEDLKALTPSARRAANIVDGCF